MRIVTWPEDSRGCRPQGCWSEHLHRSAVTILSDFLIFAFHNFIVFVWSCLADHLPYISCQHLCFPFLLDYTIFFLYIHVFCFYCFVCCIFSHQQFNINFVVKQSGPTILHLCKDRECVQMRWGPWYLELGHFFCIFRYLPSDCPQHPLFLQLCWVCANVRRSLW